MAAISSATVNYFCGRTQLSPKAAYHDFNDLTDPILKPKFSGPLRTPSQS